jgi:hypothetical protein
VFHAVLVIGVWVFFLQLIYQPSVTICSEENLAWHLIHFMTALDAASLSFVKLCFRRIVLFLGHSVHCNWRFTKHLIRQSVNVQKLKLRHILPRPSRVARFKLDVDNYQITYEE